MSMFSWEDDFFRLSEDEESEHDTDSNDSESETFEITTDSSLDSDSAEEEEGLLEIPIHVHNTQSKKQNLDGHDIVSKVRNVLECILSHGLDLPLFLDALSWGHPDCHSDRKIQYARTSLLVSAELPGILDRWYRPPRSVIEGKGRRPSGARQTLDQFAIRCLENKIDEEMQAAAPLFTSQKKSLSEEQLLSTDFSKIKLEAQSNAPTLWRILDHAASIPRQDKNTSKDPSLTTLSCFAQLQYSRSHHRNRIQKIWAIYLKACGLSARAFDAIHALGLVMSHKWASNAYNTLSAQAMKEVQEAIHKFLWHVSHDNVNIPLRVFSQRIHNQSHFISATAATIWILPTKAKLPANANMEFNRFRGLYSTKVFKYEDVLYGSQDVDLWIQAQYKYRVLCAILDSPEFADYPHRKSSLFSRPPPVQQLPTGPEFATCQFILGTAEIEEASYEGTLKVIDEIFRQLKLNSRKEETQTSTQRFIAWIGDQLTVEQPWLLYFYIIPGQLPNKEDTSWRAVAQRLSQRVFWDYAGVARAGFRLAHGWAAGLW